ncbi:hypothetical protein N2152v2_002752 [Parachlorella kessleri]
MSRVLEVGGLAGYSATNFLKALEPTSGVVYTVDINPVPVVDSTRHKPIMKNAALLTVADVDSKPLDLIFFDAHVLDAQLNRHGVVVMQKFAGLNNAEKAPPKVILGRHNIEGALLGS